MDSIALRETLVAALRAKLSKLAGITETRSCLGSPGRLAWRAGHREIAHLHTSCVIDIRLGAAEQRCVRGDARLIARRTRSHWIECRFEQPADVDLVVALVKRAAKPLD